MPNEFPPIELEAYHRLHETKLDSWRDRLRLAGEAIFAIMLIIFFVLAISFIATVTTAVVVGIGLDRLYDFLAPNTTSPDIDQIIGWLWIIVHPSTELVMAFAVGCEVGASINRARNIHLIKQVIQLWNERCLPVLDRLENIPASDTHIEQVRHQARRKYYDTVERLRAVEEKSEKITMIEAPDRPLVAIKTELEELAEQLEVVDCELSQAFPETEPRAGYLDATQSAEQRARQHARIRGFKNVESWHKR